MATCQTAIALLVCCLGCPCSSLEFGLVRPKQRHAHHLHVGRKNSSLTLAVEKLEWLHAPKTGTSFANTLMTWGCPGLPDTCPGVGEYLPDFWNDYESECPAELKNRLCGGHLPVGAGCNNLPDGRFVALFRQPEQRLISGFYHQMQSYWNPHATINEYSHAIAGCVVRMMLGHSCGSSTKLKLPRNNDTIAHVDESDADHAIETLQTFEFVGLTQEFDLSVCLFHRMYGGSCHRREFRDTRPGTNHSKQYDVDILHGFKDEVDRKLYASAESIFWSNVRKFDVHRKSCVKVCKSFPDPFLLPKGAKFRKRLRGKPEYDWPGRWAYSED